MDKLHTVKEVISDVRNQLKTVGLDTHIPAAFIHNTLIKKAELFIKRDGDDRRFYLYPDIWFTVNEVKMVPSTIVGCSDIDIPSCTKVMKSVKELPRVYTTRYGYLLLISSIDYTKDYTQTTPKAYQNTITRRYRDLNKRYYWIYNNHIVIPDSHVESITVRAMFINKRDGILFNDCDDCDCVKLLDQEFVAPPHLLDDIIKATVIDIAQIRQQRPTQEYDHLNENEKVSPYKK